MSNEERWNYILQLDEELLRGGVILSEWSTFLIKDADEAFCNGAYLAAILVAQAAIESHLRYEYFDSTANNKPRFYDLIEQSPLPSKLKGELHSLRKYRNKWVHVNDPEEDSDLLNRPAYYEAELEQYASLAMKSMRQVIYFEQFL